MCKEFHARAWLGGDDVVVKVAATASDSGKTGGGEGGAPAEVPEPPAEAPEEEQEADAIKAAMVEKYGQEIVDAVGNGVDTSS